MKSVSVFEKYTDKETFAKIVDYKNLAEMWESSVSEYRDNVAIFDGEEKYTYGDFDSEIAKFRSVLLQNGVAAGDKVGVYAPNSAGFIKAYLAINTLGAVAVLLPVHLDSTTVFGCSMKFALKALVYDESLEANIEFTKEKNPAVKLVKANESADAEAPSVSVDSNAPSTIIFTGGTTGKS